MQKRCVQLVAVAIGLGFGAYLPAVTESFLSDDFVLVNGVLEGGPFGVFMGEGSIFFRPLVSLSLYADASLWGLDARGFHVTNVLIHIGSSIWLYLLASCIGYWMGLTIPDRRAVSSLSGLVFLLHPSHTEAVSWISGRCDLLATFFVLGSLTCYVRWRYLAIGRLPWLSLLLFVGALASKESAVCLPFLIATVEALRWLTKPGKGAWKALALHVSPYLGLLVLYVIIRRFSIGHWIGGYGADIHFRLSQIVDRLLVFAARSVMPPMPERETLFWAAGVLVGVLGLIVILERVTSDRWPKSAILAGVAVAFFGCTLAPVLGLQMSFDTVAGERFVYLPSAFAILAVCAVLRLALPRRTGWVLGGAALCLACMISLTRSNMVWYQAGEIAQDIVSTLEESEAETAVLLNMPVSLDGAYIFQQGLFLALRQAGGHSPQVQVVERFALRDADADFSVQRVGNSISLHSSDHGATRAGWPAWHPRPFTVETSEQDRHGFRGRLSGLPEESRFFVFSGGSLIELSGNAFPERVAGELRYPDDSSTLR